MSGNKNDLLTAGEIAAIIESEIPLQLQESWDNSGAQIFFAENKIDRVLLALDFNGDVLHEASDIGAAMIVTHHPLLFESIKKIDNRTFKGDLILDAARRGISVYSCHTSFDKVKGGNNDRIAELLGLTSIKNLEGRNIDNPAKMAEKKSEADIGRIGRLKEAATVRKTAEIIAEKLDMNIRELRISGRTDIMVKNIGICTGAGADLAEYAQKAGCDLFVTGDVKYHEAQLADELGICIIDAGHYHTEKFFPHAFCDLMRGKLSEKVDLCMSTVDLNPFVVL